MSAFIHAIVEGRLAEARRLWEASPRPQDLLRAKKYYCLRCACWSGRLETVQCLWSLREPATGSGLTVEDLRCAHALREACDGHLALAQLLWSLVDSNGNGLTMEDVREGRSNCFKRACVAGHLEIAQWLWSLRDGAGAGLTLADVRTTIEWAYRIPLGEASVPPDVNATALWLRETVAGEIVAGE